MLHAKYQYILAGSSWEEEFWRFIKIFFILPLTGPQQGPAPLFEQIQIHIPQFPTKFSWKWFLRRSRLKEKLDARWTDAAPWQKLS